MATTNRMIDPGDGQSGDIPPGNWTVASDVAAAAQASVTKAAAPGNVRNVCNFVSVMIACAATAQTPIKAYLRDGAAGSGPILWEGIFAAPANQMAYLCEAYLNIVGSPATAMTLEFAAAGVAGSIQAVTLGGYYSVL